MALRGDGEASVAVGDVGAEGDHQLAGDRLVLVVAQDPFDDALLAGRDGTGGVLGFLGLVLGTLAAALDCEAGSLRARRGNQTEGDEGQGQGQAEGAVAHLSALY